MHNDLLKVLAIQDDKNLDFDFVKTKQKRVKNYNVQDISENEHSPSEDISEELEEDENSLEGGEETNSIGSNAYPEEEKSSQSLRFKRNLRPKRKNEGGSWSSRYGKYKQVDHSDEMEESKVKRELKQKNAMKEASMAKSNSILRQDVDEQYIFNK